MCDIIIYGTSLCMCGFGFTESASSHTDCGSPRCAVSLSHSQYCGDHERCTHPGEQRVMSVRRTFPCIECEILLAGGKGFEWDIVDSLE
ncbi:hypothetical protein K439DRAFT_1163679 [Ramaria rubella]|nr:hypothetical protein K439DRAFT_1163679 [Ramaria rubella]